MVNIIGGILLILVVAFVANVHPSGADFAVPFVLTIWIPGIFLLGGLGAVMLKLTGGKEERASVSWLSAFVFSLLGLAGCVGVYFGIDAYFG